MRSCYGIGNQGSLRASPARALRFPIAAGKESSLYPLFQHNAHAVTDVFAYLPAISSFIGSLLLQSSIPYEPLRSRESRECSSRSAVGSQFILKCLLNQHGICSHYSLKKLRPSKRFALVGTHIHPRLGMTGLSVCLKSVKPAHVGSAQSTSARPIHRTHCSLCANPGHRSAPHRFPASSALLQRPHPPAIAASPARLSAPIPWQHPAAVRPSR